MATVMLNVGLFLFLFLFTPLVVGLVIGYLMMDPKSGTLATLAGSMIAYVPFLLYAQSLAGSVIDILAVISAAVLLSIGGALGGYLGAIIKKKGLESRDLGD